MEHNVLESAGTIGIAEATFEERLRIVSDYDRVFADILSQAVTGELIGMSNFASLVGMHESLEEKLEALEHAQNERSHADAFLRAAKRMGVEVIINLKAPYWDRIRQAFLKRVALNDVIGTTIIQEVMLECFAISLYRSVAGAAKPELAKLFNAIADEEEEHLEHALAMLSKERLTDSAAFEQKVGVIHQEVVTILSEMMGKRDSVTHCGLCNGTCIKSALPLVNLDVQTLRARALNFYMTALDRMGIRGEISLTWIAQLPT